MRRWIESYVKRIVHPAFCDQISVTVPGHERRPATANMKRPRVCYRDHAVQKCQAENADKHQSKEAAEASTTLLLALSGNLPGHVIFNEPGFLFREHAQSPFRPGSNFSLCAPPQPTPKLLLLRHVFFVVFSSHCAVLIVLLYIQNELYRASTVRDPGRAFDESGRAQHTVYQRSVSRTVQRSVDLVLDRVLAVHVLAACAHHPR